MLKDFEERLKRILEFNKLLCVLTGFRYHDIYALTNNLGDPERELYERISRIDLVSELRTLTIKPYINFAAVSKDLRLFTVLARSEEGFLTRELKTLFRVKRLERFKHYDELEPYLKIELDDSLMERYRPSVSFYRAVKDLSMALSVGQRIEAVQNEFFTSFQASDLLKKNIFDYFRNKWEMYSQWDQTFLSAAHKLNDVIDLFHDTYDPNLCELDIVDWQFIDALLEKYAAEINENRRRAIRDILEPKRIKV